MAYKLGIWLDQREALLIKIDGAKEKRVHLSSSVEAHHRATGGYRGRKPFMRDGMGQGRHLERRRVEELKEFLSRILKEAEGARSIYVIGPGKSKKLLENAIQGRPDLAPRLRSVETAGQMSEAQVARQVRRYFGLRMWGGELVPLKGGPRAGAFSEAMR